MGKQPYCVGWHGQAALSLARALTSPPRYDDFVQHSDGTIRKYRRCFNQPGQAHELTFSCHRGLKMLERDRTRQWFIEALDRARHTWRFDFWAYVIMPEHAHVPLLPRELDYDVALILKGIKQSVSRRAVGFLAEHAPQWLTQSKVTWPGGRTEHRFWQQGGGYDRNVVTADVAWKSVEYIHNNPVRRGLVAGPTDWERSSARWYAGYADVKLAMDGCPPDPRVRL